MEATDISFSAGMLTMWLLWVGSLFLERVAKRIRGGKEFRTFVDSIEKCESCKKGFDGTGGSGYQPCSCKFKQ